jgi:hypothetical protein
MRDGTQSGGFFIKLFKLVDSTLGHPSPNSAFVERLDSVSVADVDRCGWFLVFSVCGVTFNMVHSL